MDIEGIGDVMAQQLTELNLVRDIADTYKLTKRRLRRSRMGKKYRDLLRNIEASKQRGPARLLYGLGIRFVGTQTAQILVDDFGTIDAIAGADETELQRSEGIGPEVARSVALFFKQQPNREMIERLRQAGVVMSAPKRVKTGGALSGQDLRVDGNPPQPHARGGGGVDCGRRRQSHGLGEQEDRLCRSGQRAREQTDEGGAARDQHPRRIRLTSASSMTHTAVRGSYRPTCLTPIGAYRALANPEASCLLESVESGGRISRYSFIGIDYLAAAELKPTPRSIRAYAPSLRSIASPIGGPLGGALLAFVDDAARPDARLPARASSEPAMPAAYVAVPATVADFDHFTDLLTLWTSGDDADALERRIDGYVERLLAAAGDFRRPLRATGPISASLNRERFLELVARGEAANLRRRRSNQLQLGHPLRRRLDGEAFDLYRALRREESRRPICSTSTRSSVKCLGARPSFRALGRGASAHPPACGHALARTRRRRRRSPRRRSWAPNEKSLPST